MIVTVIVVYSAVVVGWFVLNRLLGDVWWLLPITGAQQVLFSPLPVALIGTIGTRSFKATVSLTPVVIVFGVVFGPLLVPKIGGPPPVQDMVRLMTFNILYSNESLTDTEATIRAVAPDALVMQEVTQRQWEWLLDALAGLYPYHARAEGVAILSQYPITDEGFVTIDERPPVLWVDLEVDGRPARLIGAHLAPLLFMRLLNGPQPFPQAVNEVTAQREEAVRAISQMVVEAQTHGRAVWMGCDCNITDQTAIYRAIAGLGLRDVFREVGWGFGYTMPGHAAQGIERANYTRIDYIWHTPDTIALDVQVPDAPTGSDHLPVAATLGWK